MLKTMFNICSKVDNETITTDKDYGYCFLSHGIAFAVSNTWCRVKGKQIEKQNFWTVTHLETGLSLGRSFRTKKEAIDYAEEFLIRKGDAGMRKLAEDSYNGLLNGQHLNLDIIECLFKGIE